MNHRIITILLSALFLLPSSLFAQKKQGQARLDSLLAEAPKMREDTAGVVLMDNICNAYNTLNPSKELDCAFKELALARKIGWKKGEGLSDFDIGRSYLVRGVYPAALEYSFNALKIFE